ncbi:Metallo-dependent hydrolase [Coniophora puteana RWD-64-598 SS2]|uniref:Adenosine deaminase n=1 Tax=Coniophora puteana (strain RWD-64-598) TaxID=741705 RepID=R7SG58_CONPW|nr:Metallo-dependent hydrolase [Coniophora puteana RWD-64-598 SS2]EIW74707.1 Metallo-dependent hydrolase [Coniophora puteana RWD-64-598 SS2]
MTTAAIDVQAYNEKRSSLISQDRALRVDHVRAANHTALEKKADEVIRRIRDVEAKTVWGVKHDGVPNAFPGMEFLTGKQIVLKTKLFQLLSKMPKGAVLHAHFDLATNCRIILDNALKHSLIHVRVPRALDVITIEYTVPQVQPMHRDYVSSASSINETVPDGSWISLTKARETFPSELGGKDGFDKWMIRCMSINPSEAYGTHNNNIKIWVKFREAARVIQSMVHYVPIWRATVQQFLLELVADGISYVEVRINFHRRFMYSIDGEENVPHREWLKMFDEELSAFKRNQAEHGRSHDFFGVKIIYTMIRNISPEEMKWYMDDCITLKQEFPHLITGFDLVGDENIFNPLIYYIEPLLGFKKRLEELKLDIPFLFHAGETCGDGSHADVNLYDAILLGTKRIGHGFSLVKHPKLMEICRERGIALEVCPISNEILRLTASMPMHPLPILLNNGVPVALSSDDPALFGNMGLTFDFFQVVAASEITGLITLGELARDSITYSMLNESDKKTVTENWEKRWKAYLEELISLPI